MKNAFNAVVLVAVFLACAPAHAAESSVTSWFKNLKQGLMRSSVEGRYRNVRSRVAVAAVRGRRQGASDPSAPYWKEQGDKAAEALLRQRKELEAVVDLILAEKLDEAAPRLEAFIASKPDKDLLADARDAKVRLDEMLRQSPAPADGALPRGESVVPEKPVDASAVKAVEGVPAKAAEVVSERAVEAVRAKPAETVPGKAVEPAPIGTVPVEAPVSAEPVPGK